MKKIMENIFYIKNTKDIEKKDKNTKNNENFPENGEEIISSLLECKNIKIEKIISTGQTTDWYDQEKYEWVSLLEGNATIEFKSPEKKEVKLSRGDHILIKPHEIHRVSYTSKEPPCIWLCVFF